MGSGSEDDLTGFTSWEQLIARRRERCEAGDLTALREVLEIVQDTPSLFPAWLAAPLIVCVDREAEKPRLIAKGGPKSTAKLAARHNWSDQMVWILVEKFRRHGAKKPDHQAAAAIETLLEGPAGDLLAEVGLDKLKGAPDGYRKIRYAHRNFATLLTENPYANFAPSGDALDDWNQIVGNLFVPD